MSIEVKFSSTSSHTELVHNCLPIIDKYIMIYYKPLKRQNKVPLTWFMYVM